MAEPDKFHLRGNTLTVTQPFFFDDRQADEEAFLKKVDALMEHRGNSVVIDLVQAGSLSSTIIALAIAAGRKAKDANKTLSLKIARRNQLAVRLSGLAGLLDVQLV